MAGQAIRDSDTTFFGNTATVTEPVLRFKRQAETDRKYKTMKNGTKVVIGAGLIGGILLVGGYLQGVIGNFSWPPFAGGWAIGNGGKGSAVVSSVDKPPPPKPEPLEIMIDDNKYLVKGVEVESVDQLVKMAAAVPKEVPPPRVRILLQRSSRYVTEHTLTDALQAANIDFLPIEQ